MFVEILLRVPRANYVTNSPSAMMVMVMVMMMSVRTTRKGVYEIQ
jgi:hypothetical protein